MGSGILTLRGDGAVGVPASGPARRVAARYAPDRRSALRRVPALAAQACPSPARFNNFWCAAVNASSPSFLMGIHRPTVRRT